MESVYYESEIFYSTGSCGLYYKSFTIVIYDCNDSTIVIYDRNGSGKYYKTINNDHRVIIYDPIRAKARIINYDTSIINK